MKAQILAVAVLVLSAFTAQAEVQRSQCAFGETTADLSEMLDFEGKGKIWYKGEHLSLHVDERIKGLTALEREMIELVMAGESRNEDLIESFASADGYLTYFSHNSNDREFVIVASYPGDNEFGMILEIKGGRNEKKTLEIAAVISDGDLEDCRVQK